MWRRLGYIRWCGLAMTMQTKSFKQEEHRGQTKLLDHTQIVRVVSGSYSVYFVSLWSTNYIDTA